MSAAPEKCPKCGADTEMGYGLMGGGMGPYWYCDGENECDWFFKKRECRWCESTRPEGQLTCADPACIQKEQEVKP